MHEIRLTYEGDLPARTGLGTSSSFAVGMLNAFYSLKGEFVDKKHLANDAIHLERDLCAEAGGWQDQIAASYGGLNRIDFKDNNYRVTPIIISPIRKKELNDSLALFFTGFTRFSAVVQESTEACLSKKTEQYKEMLKLVDEAERILEDKNSSLDEFGVLLDKSWKLKKQTGDKISTSSIDSLYERGIKAGALGGKLLGAGGGGFLLFYVRPEKRDSLMNAMKDLMYVPFSFEDNGTQVVYFSAETFDKETTREK
jgi:D-glycero-alpha-D-manno-heptose-7-phosphate kinase